jgi:hypothetical protein
MTGYASGPASPRWQTGEENGGVRDRRIGPLMAPATVIGAAIPTGAKVGAGERSHQATPGGVQPGSSQVSGIPDDTLTR